MKVWTLKTLYLWIVKKGMWGEKDKTRKGIRVFSLLVAFLPFCLSIFKTITNLPPNYCRSTTLKSFQSSILFFAGIQKTDWYKSIWAETIDISGNTKYRNILYRPTHQNDKYLLYWYDIVFKTLNKICTCAQKLWQSTRTIIY